MANLITLSRLLLLFVLVSMMYAAPPIWQFLDSPLLILIIILDAVDGYVARKLGEASVFGSILDIAADRVVENVLWIVLADLGLVPMWVALIFITRSLFVDSIRAWRAAQGIAPFTMMQSSLGRFLVAGRFMRGFYGAVKAITFAWLLLLQPCPLFFPRLWFLWLPTLHSISLGLIYISVTVCLLRGMPVILEYLWSQGMLQSDTDAKESH